MTDILNFPFRALLSGVAILLIGVFLCSPGRGTEGAGATVGVEFRMEQRDAEGVSVAGSFNNWDAGAHPLERHGDLWSATVPLDPGWYYYKFVVRKDGRDTWIPDPGNPERLPDGGDSFNSVLRAGDPGTPQRRRNPEPFPGDRVPRVILDANPDWVAAHDAAWRIAWNKIQHGTPGNGFSPRYMDEAFNELIYQWDTCFMALFAVYAPQDAFPGMASLDNFYGKQRDDGYIQRVYWERDGKPAKEPTAEEPMINPPLFAWVEWRYYETTGDESRIRRVLPHLVRYFEWLETNTHSPSVPGLYYQTDLGSGMDNTPRPGVHQGAWVDASAQQALAARCIARLAGVTGDKELEQRFTARHGEIAGRLREACWNPDTRFFHDRTAGGDLSPVKHAGAFWTLLAGVADEPGSEGLLDGLRNPAWFWRPHLVPALSADDPRYSPRGHYWLGGVWAPVNYMITRGLAETGQGELARAIAENHVAHIARIFRDYEPVTDELAYEQRFEDGYHTLWECYAPEGGGPATRWDGILLSRQDFVGWTGLGPIAMLYENILGLDLRGADNRIVWTITRADSHGVRSLPFRGHPVDLLATPGPGGRLVLETRTKEPFTLEIHHRGRTVIFDVPSGEAAHEIAAGGVKEIDLRRAARQAMQAWHAHPES